MGKYTHLFILCCSMSGWWLDKNDLFLSNYILFVFVYAISVQTYSTYSIPLLIWVSSKCIFSFASLLDVFSESCL